VSKSETRENLEELIGDIEAMIETLEE